MLDQEALHGFCTGMVADRCDWYELHRIPAAIWPAVEAGLKKYGDVHPALLQALCTSFPGCSLPEVMRRLNMTPDPLRRCETIHQLQVCFAPGEDCLLRVGIEGVYTKIEL